MAPLSPATVKPRLVSLDVFRGATVAAMILVNNPGSWDHVYWPLDHAQWNGCTPTDLIMPFFLFIVGVSIAYAMDIPKQQSTAHASLILRVLKRAGVLLLLGWSLALFPTSQAAVHQLLHTPLQWLGAMRIMGVLQRIAIVYLICALIFLKTGWRSWVWSCAGICIVYWIILTLMPVPNINGHWFKANLSAESSFGAWVDRTLLTSPHLYRHGQWDPEGLLSTISAVSTGLIGMTAGYYLKKSEDESAAKVAWLAAGGTLLMLTGWVWSLTLPFNKQLWTGSFALYTGGLATLVLAIGYWLIDVNGYRRFTAVFVAFGVNAITAFWGSGLLVRLLMLWQVSLDGSQIGVKDYLYKTCIERRFASPELASFVGALIFLGIWSAISLLMYRRHWLIKV